MLLSSRSAAARISFSPCSAFPPPEATQLVNASICSSERCMQQGAHRPGSCRVPGSRRLGPRSSRARAASWLLRRAPSPALPTLLEPQRATALWPGCCREDPWRCPSMPSHSSDLLQDTLERLARVVEPVRVQHRNTALEIRLHKRIARD